MRDVNNNPIITNKRLVQTFLALLLVPFLFTKLIFLLGIEPIYALLFVIFLQLLFVIFAIKTVLNLWKYEGEVIQGYFYNK
jgi:hypothetical protein